MENILITGVSTGIGYSLGRHFLNSGCRVLGSVRKKEDADRLRKELGDDFHPLIFDVVDHRAIHNSVDVVKGVIREEGLSCLINNAGIAVGGPVMHVPVEEYKRQFDVNLFGLIAVTQAYLPLLGAVKNNAKKPGKILNISSTSGQIAFPFMSPYCASKFALEGFGDSLRRELLMYGIDVISIEPGPIKTPIWDKSVDVPEELFATDFGPAVKKFLKGMKEIAEGGMEPEVLADKIYKVYRKKRPKVRYTFMNKKFTNFIVPKYMLSARKFDNFIRKTFFAGRT